MIGASARHRPRNISRQWPVGAHSRHKGPRVHSLPQQHHARTAHHPSMLANCARPTCMGTT
eukprot:13147267-Alexandrium_andersonii.AAC.1